MSRAQLDGFFASTFHFHAVRFDRGIIFERVVDDAPVEGVQWLQLDDVAPAAHLLGGFLRFLDERVAGLGTVIPYIHHYLRDIRILLEEDPIDQVLQVRKSLSLATDQAAGIFRLHIQKQSFLQLVFFDSSVEAEVLENSFENLFG